MAPSTPPTLQGLAANLDILLGKMDALAALQHKVIELETTVTTLGGTVDRMGKEIAHLKDQINYRDQADRGLSVRISGLSVIFDDDVVETSKTLHRRVYDLIKPSLLLAKQYKQIETIPQLANVFEDCYRCRPPVKPGFGSQPPPPPQIIVKFSSSALRLAFLRNKREGLPKPSDAEKAAGIKRYIAGEDLTPPTFRKLREMQTSDKFERAWTIDGRIRYTLPGDKTVRRVKSVFADIEQLF